MRMATARRTQGSQRLRIFEPFPADEAKNVGYHQACSLSPVTCRK